MARQISKRDLSSILAAAEQWLKTCLIEDHSLFQADARWTASLVDEVYRAFVEHPDYGDDDFMTKLKRQMKLSSPSAQQLMAEMLWALLLFPSNMKARTKRLQISSIWSLSGRQLDENHALLSDAVLVGIGSGGPGFNNYRPLELEYLISLVRDLKQKSKSERKHILTDYDAFFNWIDAVPRNGKRQLRHMLRYFSFPDRVERISSNNDRRKILAGFGIASFREIREWGDRKLDEKLMELRTSLQGAQPSGVLLDFYDAPFKEKWSSDHKIKTPEGEITVTVPADVDEPEDLEPAPAEAATEVRKSIWMQAKLARIGAVMGFRVWIPRADRARVRDLVPQKEQLAFLEILPLNYETATLETIEQIDVIWLKGRSIARAFEVEHTTAVYSGLLRMADLLALQPNMAIRLHIVAPDERREKVFREMNRPVFSLLDRGPLSDMCTFISYESVDEMDSLEHLAHTKDGIIADYEEESPVTDPA